LLQMRCTWRDAQSSIQFAIAVGRPAEGIEGAALSPGRISIDSRMTPMRLPLSEPGAPIILAWLAYPVVNTEERGTVV
jgi:hypothetical protein